jgi:hypothetical protein
LITVIPASPTLAPLAAATAPSDQPLTFSAQLSGGGSPTGTVQFLVYGPGDPTCAAAPVATLSGAVNGNGVVTSNAIPPPIAPGTYSIRVSYSGDTNNNAVAATACGAPNSTTTVTLASTPVTPMAPPALAPPTTTPTTRRKCKRKRRSAAAARRCKRKK